MSIATRASALRAALQGGYRRAASAPGAGSERSAATAAAAGHPDAGPARSKLRGDYVPVYVALGLIVLSVSLGATTARQQLAHSPNVRVDKKRRETVPEVAAPDVALDEAERFVGKSLFRKVAHVQDDRSLAAAGVADPVVEYPYAVVAAWGRKAVTLKDVGLETPGIEQAREGVLDRIFKKNNA